MLEKADDFWYEQNQYSYKSNENIVKLVRLLTSQLVVICDFSDFFLRDYFLFNFSEFIEW